MFQRERKLSKRGKLALPLAVSTVLFSMVVLAWAVIPDFDGDGLLDNEEILYGTFGYGLSNNDALNPNNVLDNWIDTDMDGVADPYDWDVDGDLVPDYIEVNNAQIHFSRMDWDKEAETEVGIDGRVNPYHQTNPFSFDSDGDGRIESYMTYVGNRAGTSITNPNGMIWTTAGANSKGLPKWVFDKYNFTNNADNNKASAGRDCVVNDVFNPNNHLVIGESVNWDADNDGLVDAQDVDSDNDGIVDSYIDVNQDGDYDRGIDIAGEDIPSVDIDDDDCDEIDAADGARVSGADTNPGGDTDYEEDLAGSFCTSTRLCKEGEGWEFSDGIWDADGLDNQFRATSIQADGRDWDYAWDNETHALNADTDFDGLGDKWEVAWGTNALDADTDDDGLVDGWVNLDALIETWENHGVMVYDGNDKPGEYILGTDPLDPDTDGDGLTDGVEVGLTATQLAGNVGSFPDGVQYPTGADMALYNVSRAVLANRSIPFTNPDLTTHITVYQHGLARALWVYDQDAVTTTDPLNKDSDYDGLPDGWINGWGNYFWRDDYALATPPNDVEIDLGEGEDMNSNGRWDGGTNLTYGPDPVTSEELRLLFPNETFYKAYWTNGAGGDPNDMTSPNTNSWASVPPAPNDPITAGLPAGTTMWETSATRYDSDGDGLSDGEEILTDRWLGNDDLDGDNSPAHGGYAYNNDWDGSADELGNSQSDNVWLNHAHDQDVNYSYSARTDRPGADGTTGFRSSMRDRTDPLKPDSDGDGIWDGREVKREDPCEVCYRKNFVLYGYTTNPLFANSDGLPSGMYDNKFVTTNSSWDFNETSWNQGYKTTMWEREVNSANRIDKRFNENGYAKTWLGAPYLWWVGSDLRDDNWQGCGTGDCTDYPVPSQYAVSRAGSMTTPATSAFSNNHFRYRTEVDGQLKSTTIGQLFGDVLGYYDYQYDSRDPKYRRWSPDNRAESPYADSDLDGMVDALDPNTFYNDDDLDGLPNLFEDDEMDGVDMPYTTSSVCAANGGRWLSGTNKCVDADNIWMPGETWLETSKWDGDTDDDGLWDGDEMFPARIDLDDIPNYMLYISDALDRDSDDDGVVDGYNNGGTRVRLVHSRWDLTTYCDGSGEGCDVNDDCYRVSYGPYNPWDPRTFNDGAWPGNSTIKSFVCRWVFNTGRNTPTNTYENRNDFAGWANNYPQPASYVGNGLGGFSESVILRENFYNIRPDIPGELVATIDYRWTACQTVSCASSCVTRSADNYPDQIWDFGHFTLLPTGPQHSMLFRPYYTSTDPLNPDTDGDHFSDGWLPTYNYFGRTLHNDAYTAWEDPSYINRADVVASGALLLGLLNHDANEPYYQASSASMRDKLPHFVYPSATEPLAGEDPFLLSNSQPFYTYTSSIRPFGAPDVPVFSTLPTFNSGDKDVLNADWLRDNNGASVALPTASVMASLKTQTLDNYTVTSNVRFYKRFFQPPVNWGYFRTSYYHGAFNNQQQATDRFYEYMLYDDHGIVRTINPWGNDQFDLVLPSEGPRQNVGVAQAGMGVPGFSAVAGTDNQAGDVFEGWGRAVVSPDYEGTPYTTGNNDQDLMINALDRDSDDDEVFDLAERRGQKFQEEPGSFLNQPLHPSNSGNNNSDFNYDGSNSSGDYEEYLANNSHPMRQWDDDVAEPQYDDEDGDEIANVIEFAMGTNYALDDSDFDGISDFREVNDFMFRAPGDAANPGGQGQRTGLGTNPCLADGDGDGLTDGQEWRGALVDNEYTNILINDGDHIVSVTGVVLDGTEYVYRHPAFNNYTITYMLSNPSTWDTDLDGRLDVQEVMVDGVTDGLTGLTCYQPYGEVRPGLVNHNGIWSPRDPDDDGDFLIDGSRDDGGRDLNIRGYDDADQDCLADFVEQIWYTDPNNTDTDFDGLSDFQELVAHDRTPLNAQGRHAFYGWHRTEPTLWDTDGDGIADGWTNKDWLGYSIGYWTGEDRDLDGRIAGDVNNNRVWDVNEMWTETDALNRDSDGQYGGFKDGLVDGYEENTNLMGAGATAGANNSPFETDRGETNPLSLDSDNDYLVDNMEMGLGTFYPYFNMPFEEDADPAGGREDQYDDEKWSDMYDPARDYANEFWDGSGPFYGANSSDPFNSPSDNDLNHTNLFRYNDADRDDDGILDGHEYWEALAGWTAFKCNGDPNSPSMDWYQYLPSSPVTSPFGETYQACSTEPYQTFFVFPTNSCNASNTAYHPIYGNRTYHYEANNGLTLTDARRHLRARVEVGTGPMDWDTDKDGLFDGLEIGIVDGTVSSFTNGYSIQTEELLGITYPNYLNGTALLPPWTTWDMEYRSQTDPFDYDSDNDFLPDGWLDSDGDVAQYAGWTMPDDKLIGDFLPDPHHPVTGDTEKSKFADIGVYRETERRGEDGYSHSLSEFIGSNNGYTGGIPQGTPMFDGAISGDIGAVNVWENREKWLETNPMDADTDEDGLTDGFEDADADRWFGMSDMYLNGPEATINNPNESGSNLLVVSATGDQPFTQHLRLENVVKRPHHGWFYETNPLMPSTDHDGLLDGMEQAFRYPSYRNGSLTRYGVLTPFGFTGPLGVYEHWESDSRTGYQHDMEGYSFHTGHWDAVSPTGSTDRPIKVRRDLDPFADAHSSMNKRSWVSPFMANDNYDYDHENGLDAVGRANDNPNTTDTPCDVRDNECRSNNLHYKGSYELYWVEDRDYSTSTFALIDDSDKDGLYDGGYLRQGWVTHSPDMSWGEDRSATNKRDVVGMNLFGNGLREAGRTAQTFNYRYTGELSYMPDKFTVAFDQNSTFAVGFEETDPTIAFAYGASPRAWFGPGFDGSERPEENLYNPFGVRSLVGANQHRKERFNPFALRVGYDTDGGNNGSAYFNNLTPDVEIFTNASFDDDYLDAHAGFKSPFALKDSLGAENYIVNDLDQDVAMNITNKGTQAPLVNYNTFPPTIQAYRNGSARPMLSLWTNDGAEVHANSDPVNSWGNLVMPFGDQDVDIIDFHSQWDTRRNVAYWGVTGLPEAVTGPNGLPTSGTTNFAETNDMWLLDVGDDFPGYATGGDLLEFERPNEMLLDDNNDLIYPSPLGTGRIYGNVEGEYDPLNYPTGNGQTLEPGDVSEVGKFRTFYTNYASNPNGNSLLTGKGDNFYKLEFMFSPNTVGAPSYWFYNMDNLTDWDNTSYRFIAQNDGYTTSLVYPFDADFQHNVQLEDGNAQVDFHGNVDIRYQATGLIWSRPLPGTETDYACYMYKRSADIVPFPAIKIGRPYQEFPLDNINNVGNDTLTIVPNNVFTGGFYHDAFIQAGPFPANKPTSADSARDWHGGTYSGEVYAIASDGYAYDNFLLTFHVKELIPDLDIDNDNEGMGLNNNVMYFNIDPEVIDQFMDEDLLDQLLRREIVIGVPNTGQMNVDFDSYDGPGTVGVQQVSIFDPDTAYAIYLTNATKPWLVDNQVYSRAWKPITTDPRTTASVWLYNYEYFSEALYKTCQPQSADFYNSKIRAYIVGSPTINPGSGHTKRYNVVVDSAYVKRAEQGLYMTYYQHSPFRDYDSEDGMANFNGCPTDLYPHDSETCGFELYRSHRPNGNVYIVAKGDDSSGPMMFNPFEPITEVCIDWFRIEFNLGREFFPVEMQYGAVQVTNITTSSASISWTTLVPGDTLRGVKGRVDYGQNGQLNASKGDDRGDNFRGTTHYVTLTGLMPNTTYIFQVVSGANPDNNNGLYYSFTTLPIPGSPEIPDVKFLSGCVTDNGQQLTNDVVIYVITPDDCVLPGYSSLTQREDLSTYLDNGRFTINIGDRCFGENGNDFVTIIADGGWRGIGLMMVPYSTLTGTNPVLPGCIELNGNAIYLYGPGFGLFTPPGRNYDQTTADKFFAPNGPLTSRGDLLLGFTSNGEFAWPNSYNGLAGTGFPIEVGKGYMAYLTQRKALPFTGTNYQPITSPIQIPFVDGYNAVGFPGTQGLAASAVLGVGSGTIPGDTTQIIAWDETRQAWIAYFHIDNVGYFGSFDFAVEPEKGYIVYTNTGGSYTPPAFALTSITNPLVTTTDSHNGDVIVEATAMSDVHLTDVTSVSATLNWFTNGTATTTLRYGLSPDAMLNEVNLKDAGMLHQVVLKGLTADQTYFYQAVSGDLASDVKTFRTAKHGFGVPKFVWGQATDAQGKVLANSLVMATIESDGFASQTISATTDMNGHFVLNLGNLKTQNGYALNYGANDQMNIQVIGGFDYAATDLNVTLTGENLQNVGRVTLRKASETAGTGSGTTVTRFAMSQNYPNPFNPSTTIRYQLPVDTRVTLKIYNATGQLVKTLVNAEQKSGLYNATWNGTNDRNEAVGSGIYFYEIEAGAFKQTNKMVMLK